MRAFWALIVVLVLGAIAAVVLQQRAHSSASAPAPRVVTPEPEASRAAHTATTAPEIAVAPASPNVVVAPLTESPAPPSAVTTTAPQTTPAPAASVDAGMGGAIDPNDPLAAAMAKANAKFESAAAKAEARGVPGVKPTRSADVIGEYSVTPDTFRERADGALIVNEKFVVRGKGTNDQPFVVPWELLVSAEEVFDPSAKKNAIPERVAMLDGKTVKLDGYVAFPLMSPKPKELLAMLNQWDGCCIGVPPTPYDAVEVKLNKIVAGDDRHAITGSVTGTFKVAPYVTKGKDIAWLVGLYVMEEADFAAKDVVGAGS